MTDRGRTVATFRRASRDDHAGSAVGRVIVQLREMIIRGDLAPGEHVRQEELAVSLEMSRAPVREALKSLATEGLMWHSFHQGYFVVRLDGHEMGQIYLMRRLLETSLIETARWPDGPELAWLEKQNRKIRAAIDADAVAEVIALNRDFHFRIFELSDAELVTTEVRRLWDMSDSYRAVYLLSPDSRVRVPAEHDELIEALNRHDRAGCVEIMDRHRNGAEERVRPLLRSRG